MWYSQITHSVRVRAAGPPLCTILLLHTPLKHLTHEQPAQSATLSNLDVWGESCGGACTPHLPEVSRHYGEVVKCFASGQCGPGSIPGWCRSCSWHLQQSSKAYCCKTSLHKISSHMIQIIYFYAVFRIGLHNNPDPGPPGLHLNPNPQG